MTGGWIRHNDAMMPCDPDATVDVTMPDGEGVLETMLRAPARSVPWHLVFCWRRSPQSGDATPVHRTHAPAIPPEPPFAAQPVARDTSWSPWTNDKPWAFLTQEQRRAMVDASDHWAVLQDDGGWAFVNALGSSHRDTYRAVRILFGAP